VFKYPFYHIISIYVSHFSLKLEKGSGSDSDSRSSDSRLFDSADRNGSSLNFLVYHFIINSMKRKIPQRYPVQQ